MKKYWIIKMAGFFALIFAVKSMILMVLWNWLVPELFHGPAITFIQSVGLILLSKMLFIGFGGMRGGSSACGGRWNEWKKKLDTMSPEEREKMHSLWKQRCRRMAVSQEPAGKHVERSAQSPEH